MKILKLSTLIMILLVLGACKKDENDVEQPTSTNEEELITTVSLHFTETTNTADTLVYTFKDIDGAGGNDATIDTIKLSASATYRVSVELLNESVDPAEDITVEVKEEGDEHLFCYSIYTPELDITKIDSDLQYPIGIQSEWVTSNAAISSVMVTLKHQPNGAKDGTCDPGETDIEVTFPLVIQ